MGRTRPQDWEGVVDDELFLEIQDAQVGCAARERLGLQPSIVALAEVVLWATTSQP